jgi:hypothetical protein
MITRRRPACSPRHRLWCSLYHSQLVQEYRDARDAREALRESATPVPAAYAGGASVSHFQLERDDFAQLHPPILFRDFLVDHAERRRQGAPA